MHIGVVHTAGSPCGCAEAVSAGLKALGHEVTITNSEDIEFRALRLARECDLIIDHTDTFHGRGLFRALVRLMLEGHGARLVGSGAWACYVADDKIASKDRLVSSGIATPPGIVITSKKWNQPPWLRFPLVLKPAFEHMSRGVVVVKTKSQMHAMVEGMLNNFKQPIIAESYIPGRELAVSVLEGPGGLEVLPPLEWKLGEERHGFLTEAFKLTDQETDRRDATRAVLPDDRLGTLKDLVHQAFRSLGLRDYARFDLKLTPDGTFYFLEANVTPSLERAEALALSAEWAGLDYPSLVDRMLSAALNRYGSPIVDGETTMTIELPTGPIEILVPQGVHAPPRSTMQLATLLDVRPGDRVMELGCGTGALSVAAARLGAKKVVAIDIVTKALEATLHNARLNNVEKQVEVRSGSWYEAAGGKEAAPGKNERYEVIIATPPQTPGPFSFGPRYGGPDGTQHLFEVIDGAHAYLSQKRGRLWLLAISLANPRAVLERLKKHFEDVTLVHQTDRPFTADEYDAVEKGLFDYLVELRNHGIADFRDTDDGRHCFQNLFIRASGVKKS